MKKTLPYSFILVLVSLFFLTACIDSGDDFDHNSLYSSWERSHYHEDHGLNYVASLIFKRDGTYERSTKFRDPDTEALVGYIHFEEGTFRLDGYNIDFIQTKYLFIGHELFWGPFEDLQEWDFITTALPATSTLEYREGLQ